MDNPIAVGDKVWTGVHTLGVWRRMAVGIVKEIKDGAYHVDVMSLHGGAPWIQLHRYVEPYIEEPNGISKVS